MKTAWAVLQRQYAGLRCSVSLSLLLCLYDTCVAPVGSYGCEIWGFLSAAAGMRKKREGIAALHLQQLRQIAGMRRNVPSQVVCLELMSPPLHKVWTSRMATFWNNTVALGQDSLFKLILLDSVVDAQMFQVVNWSSAFHEQLQSLQYSVVGGLSLPLIDTSCLSSLFDARFTAVFDGLDICPRLCNSAGAMLCVYNAWFCQPPAANRHLLKKAFGFPLSLVRAFLRFKTGSHNLPSVTGRFSGTPRHLRKCLHCASGAICDEYHLVFECPALADLRQEYSCLFGDHASTVLLFVWQEDTLRVMKFVNVL